MPSKPETLAELLGGGWRYYAGPHLSAGVDRLHALAELLGPQADVKDYTEGVQGAARSAMRGDWSDAALNAGYAGAGLLGVALPGSASGYREIAETALDMSPAAKAQRAQDMGYTIDAYHGTAGGKADRLDEFKLQYADPAEPGFFFFEDPQNASRFAQEYFPKAEPTVLPVKLNPGRMVNVDYTAYAGTPDYSEEWVSQIIENAKAVGADSIRLRNIREPDLGVTEQVIVLNPTNIRSRFAAFDPAKRDSRNIMSGVAGAGLFGLGVLGQGDGEQR